MSLDVHAGSFVLDADPKAVTGVGFTPKLLIFWSGAFTGDADEQHNGIFSIGFSDGTNERSMGFRSAVSGAGITQCARRAAADALIMPFSGGSVDWRITVDSLDGDGFTVSSPPDQAGQSGSNAAAAADRVFYLALGGDDLEEISIASFDAPSSASTQNLNIGFRPDFMLFLCGDTEAGSDETNDAAGVGPADVALSIGMWTKLQQMCATVRSQNNVTTSLTFDTFRESLLALFADGGSSLKADAEFQYDEFEDEALTDSRFSIRWTKSVSTRVFYLAIKGPTVIGGISQSPTKNQKTAVSGLQVTPKGLLTLATSSSPSIPSDVSGMGLMWGMGTVDYQRVITVIDPHTKRVPEPRFNITDGIVRLDTTNGLPRAVGRIDEFCVEAATFEWTHVRTHGQMFGWIALGDATPAAIAAVVTDHVVKLADVGAEVTTESQIQSIVWVGAKAVGDIMRLGESSSGDPTITLVEMTCAVPFQTQQLLLGGGSFQDGFQVTRLDSGVVFVYLDGAPLVIHQQDVAATGNTILVAAPGAGLRIYVRRVFVSAGIGANNMDVTLTEGAGGTVRWRTAIDDNEWQVAQETFEPYWRLPFNTALVATQNAADNIHWTIQYYIAS